MGVYNDVSLGGTYVHRSGESAWICFGETRRADGNRVITIFRFDAVTKEGERIYMSIRTSILITRIRTASKISAERCATIVGLGGTQERILERF